MTVPAPDEIDVLLLAAGFALRLRPLTEEVPKPLLPVCGLAMLDGHLVRLRELPSPRVRRAVVNGHHLAGQVRAHLEQVQPSLAGEDRGWIVFSPEAEILGTGGAISNAAHHLRSDPFVVLNADSLFAAPVAEAVAYHRGAGFTATMVVTASDFWPNVLVDGGTVTAILPGERDPRGYTFTGLHVVSSRLLAMLPAGFHDIRDTYKLLAKIGQLGAFVWPPAGARTLPFLDIGTPAHYLEAHRICAGPESPLAAVLQSASRMGLIQPGRSEDGFIHARARVGTGATVRESIVLWDAVIGPGVAVERSIVGPGVQVAEDLVGMLVTARGRREIA